MRISSLAVICFHLAACDPTSPESTDTGTAMAFDGAATTGVAETDSADELSFAGPLPFYVDQEPATEPTTSASSAPPSPSCYGSSCYGLDPDSMGCKDDAVTIAFKERDNTCIKTRYSAACGTWWGWVYRKDTKTGCADKGTSGYLGIQFRAGPSSSDAITTWSASATGISLKSGMVYSPTTSYVFSTCGRGSSTASMSSGCTTWDR